jgi:hypothetical protein
MRRIIFVVLFYLATTGTPHAGSAVVIVHPDASENSASLASIRAMFVMRLTEWPDGSPVRVFVLGDIHPLHIDFAKQFLGIFPYQLRRAWDRLVFSGTGESPQRVETTAEMRRMIASTPGSIGYLSTEELDESVRQLQIDQE